MSADNNGGVHFKTHCNGKPVTIEVNDNIMVIESLNNSITHNFKAWNRILEDGELKILLEIVVLYNDDEEDY